MKGHVGMETQKSNQTRYYTAMLLRITIPTSLIFQQMSRGTCYVGCGVIGR